MIYTKFTGGKFNFRESLEESKEGGGLFSKLKDKVEDVEDEFNVFF